MACVFLWVRVFFFFIYKLENCKFIFFRNPAFLPPAWTINLILFIAFLWFTRSLCACLCISVSVVPFFLKQGHTVLWHSVHYSAGFTAVLYHPLLVNSGTLPVALGCISYFECDILFSAAARRIVFVYSCFFWLTHWCALTHRWYI